MKWFLITTFGLLLFSLLAVVAVWWWLTARETSPPTQVVPDGPQYAEQDHLGAPEPESSDLPVVVANEDEVEGPEGIPLRELSLSPEQQSVVATLGIDPETFVITPSMQECAREKLGGERFTEVLDGAAPGPLEVVRLGLCLGA